MQTKSALTLPAGFVEQHTHNRIWWVKAAWEETLPAGLGRFQSAIPYRQSGIPPEGGRGPVQRIESSEQGNIIIRHYQRGGFVRHFARSLYWDRPLRPLVELICTETARQRGVPTVEVLGAGVEWVGLGLYHGTFITREAEGCINLWEWLHGRPTGQVRETAVATVAQAIACMHNAGIAHADLNLTNILVQITTDSPVVLLIDFDRAHIFPGSLPPPLRERNLRRLHRSLNKLDPSGLLSSPTDLEIFCWVYRQHLPP